MKPHFFLAICCLVVLGIVATAATAAEPPAAAKDAKEAAKDTKETAKPAPPAPAVHTVKKGTMIQHGDKHADTPERQQIIQECGDVFQAHGDCGF